MKASAKPLSSPGKADKFPPPLMRFLRSNAGSRSRGRSRSSPLFYLRARNRVPTETTQEPSSPKVTCIGQVRVRRAAKSKGRRGAAVVKRCGWWWVKKPVFCGKFCPSFRDPKSPFRRFFCKWGSVFRFGGCKKVDSNKEDSFRVHSGRNREMSQEDVPGCNINTNFISCRNIVCESDLDKKDSAETACSCPPKNALMLTRCRSAPYRSSSLAGMFWGSPLADATKGDCEAGNEGELEPRISGESSKELENSSVKNEEEFKGNDHGGGAVHVDPLVLTRCKSGPARTWERLIPDSNFSSLNS